MRRLSGLALRYLLVLLAVAAAFYGARIGLHAWDRAQARRLLASAQQADNPDALRKLATLLNRGTLPQDLGNQVLRALVSPKLLVRDQYPVGRRVIVGIGISRPVNLPCLFQEFSGAALAGGESLDRFGERTFSGPQMTFLQFTRGLAPDGTVVALTNAGAFQGRVVLRCQLWAERPPFPASSNRALPLYACETELPVHLELVSASEIKPLPLVSNAELDEKMRKAFLSEPVGLFVPRYVIVPPGWGGRSLAEESRIRRRGASFDAAWSNSTARPAAAKASTEIRGETEQRYSSLPMSIALRAKYRHANGREQISQSFELAEFAGQSGILTIYNYQDIFEALPPGEYCGDLILFTDPDVAYENPFISRIWSGTLTFPMNFTITAQTNQDKAVPPARPAQKKS